MALRSGHGHGAGVPRIEVLPADELPVGVPGAARPAAARDDAGRFIKGPGTAELARAGGKAAQEARQLARLLGLTEVPEDHPFAPYARLAREWRDDHMAQLAETVGGGEVGPGPASIVSTAALQLAASRWLSDLGAQSGDAKSLLEASKLGNDSRQNLLAAFELCAREAKARGQRGDVHEPWFMPAAEQPARAATLPAAAVAPVATSDDAPASEDAPQAQSGDCQGVTP